MKSIIIFLLLLITSYVACYDNNQYIGFGWNVLNNERKLPIFEVTDSCSIVYPLLISDIKSIFEINDRMDEFKSVTSKSIAAKVGIFGLGGSYSTQYQTTKYLQNKEKSTYLRREHRHERYNVLINKDSCNISLPFRNKIKLIAGYIEINDDDTANQLIQEMIRDYGTHFITKSVIGATLFMEVFVSDSYFLSTSSSTKIESIAATFLSAKFQLGAGSETGVSQSEANFFSQHVTKTDIYTVGGNIYSTQTGLAGWEITLSDKNLASIDLDGQQIHELIALDKFEAINAKTLTEIRNRFKKYIEVFYLINTKKGCMKRIYRSFDPTANVHIQSNCKNDNIYPNEYYYGGTILATTSFTPLLSNLITNKHTCNSNFREIMIEFGGGQIFSVCAATKKPPQEVYFGGGYSSNNENFATGTKSCPSGFTARWLGTYSFICESLLASTTVLANSVPFGGLIYSNFFEGLIDTARPTCPEGLDKELLFFTNANQVVYVCSKSKVKTPTVALIEPPFKEIPNEILENLNNQNKENKSWFENLDLLYKILLIAGIGIGSILFIAIFIRILFRKKGRSIYPK